MVKRLRLLAALAFLVFVAHSLSFADPLLPGLFGPVSAGESETRALARSWPHRISTAGLRDGEWMVRIDDEWFAWAHGRLLPQALRARWEQFAPLPFYPYPLSMPPLAALDERDAARLRQLVRDRRSRPPRRSEDFLAALLRGAHRSGIESRLVKLEVAGFSVKVHEMLREPLGRVSATLDALRAIDPEIAAFLTGLSEINGYNFRNVEGTRSRSLHSYGLAIDLIPKSYGGANAYWLWAMSKTPDWWTIPYERRWMPPPAVIEAFEREGFIWGGKWIFFDTMHFEYRPEVLLLAREKSAGDAAVSPPRS